MSTFVPTPVKTVMGVGSGVGVGVGVAVGVGVGVGEGSVPVTVTHGENAEVLFAGSVAVAVTTWPGTRPTGSVTLMFALQLPSVVTFVAPINVWPSPLPDGSQVGVEKNSMRNCLPAVLLSEPAIAVLMPELLVELNTG